MSNDDPRLPASRMETGPATSPGPSLPATKHLRGPSYSASCPHLVLLKLTFSSPPLSSPFFSHVALISVPSPVFSYLPPPACPSPPCFPLSTPPFLFASLLPSSLCPTVQVRRGSVRHFLCKPQVQTTPCEGISATTDSDALYRQGRTQAHVCMYTPSYCAHVKYMVVFGSKLGTTELSVCRKKKETCGKNVEKNMNIEMAFKRNSISTPSRINKNA